MEPKLVKTRLAEYVPAEFSGKNESGIHPVGDRVLVLPDQASKTSSGLIHFTDEQISRNAEAAETGVIVEIGQEAFIWNSDRTRKWESKDKPKVGTRVAFDRYAGGFYHGKDSQMYRLMDDKCIGATADADEPEPVDHTAIRARILDASKETLKGPAIDLIRPASQAPDPGQAPANPPQPIATPPAPVAAAIDAVSLGALVTVAIAESPTAAKNLRSNPSLVSNFVDVVFDRAKGAWPRDSIDREVREQLFGLSAKE